MEVFLIRGMALHRCDKKTKVNTMTKTELIERIKKAAQAQAAKKAEQQERAKAFIEKMKEK